MDSVVQQLPVIDTVLEAGLRIARCPNLLDSLASYSRLVGCPQHGCDLSRPATRAEGIAHRCTAWRLPGQRVSLGYFTGGNGTSAL